jgi:type IV secretory pathway VirB2 component (pilin)
MIPRIRTQVITACVAATIISALSFAGPSSAIGSAANQAAQGYLSIVDGEAALWTLVICTIILGIMRAFIWLRSRKAMQQQAFYQHP